MTILNRREAIGGLAAGAAVAGFGPAKAQSKPKIAFTLLFEPGGDVGWDPEHMRGVNMARAFHGDAVQIDTFHSVHEWGKGNEGSVHIQRYKGLGEMNAEQLWDTTMNPEFRTMRQVSIENGTEADRVFFFLLVVDGPPRREFIEKHAVYANIDI